MGERTVITPATAAADFAFTVPDGRTVQFCGEGFAGADAINLQIRRADGTYQNLLDSTGVAVTLSTTTGNTLQVVGPFLGRWSKGVTGGSVGLTAFDDWVSR